ncbi:MAG: YigZ family protein [Ruminiclostridium sp.]|nr:YigZ family protein [Ruminiclostridium sp.]
MAEYHVPAQAFCETEFTEKRSRFIGHIWRVETEEEAREKISEMRSQYYDARHNCWCYIIREGNVVRYSDDGEPQGTAGQPMLEVFKREGVENVCCVVTRYFGGILLGTGGLVRAYTKSAKDTLEASGIAVVRQWVETAVSCPYSLFERMKLEVAAAQGILGEIEYGSDVRLYALLPAENWADYEARVTELTAGQIAAEKLGEVFRAGPAER